PGDVDGLRGDHRVIGCGNYDELVFAPWYCLDTRVLDRPLHERHVDAKFEEGAQHGAGVRARRLNPDARMPRVESAEVGREQVRRDRGAGGNTKNAALEAPDLTKLTLGGALDAEQLGGTRVECAAGLGECDGFPRSVEQRDVELPLEFRQRLGDGRLAQTKH